MKLLTVADMYSCAGGFSLGFDYLYEFFDVKYAVDNWENACASYKANMPNVDVDCRNVLDIKPSEIPLVDVLIGSPPCQEFTCARALGFEKRSFDTSLIDWFLSVVSYMKPRYWIMENVPIVRNYVKAPKLQIYRMTDYGIPQLRRRMFAGVYEEPKKDPIEIRFPTVLNEAGGSTFRPPKLGIRLGAVFRRRSLVYEMKLIQTFPLDYVLCGSLKDQVKQLGEAVPPLMSYKIAKAIARVSMK